ncbi:putative leader peptide [Streptomyces sp. NPDC088746]|uniref:putative leader peptide n=1 Tax=Streptomyces sp. NPDC088746 TaxID=3365885 RepID=UPI0037F99808
MPGMDGCYRRVGGLGRSASAPPPSWRSVSRDCPRSGRWPNARFVVSLTPRGPGRAPPTASGGSWGQCPQCEITVDRLMARWAGSLPMQPLGDHSVTLVERRHVDLGRVASAICRCA